MESDDTEAMFGLADIRTRDERDTSRWCSAQLVHLVDPTHYVS